MDIHKPHVAKNWREFLIELGTIVAGILIALGLEQAVEMIHDRVIAGEARDSVRAEVGENLWWVETRARDEPCVRRRLAEIGAMLDQARSGKTIPVVHHLGGVPHAKLTTLRWQANAQAGRASLFSPLEQRYLGNMYYTTDEFDRAQNKEEEVWSKLGALEGLDRLTPEETHDFGVLLAEARYQNFRIVVSIYRARQWASRMHLKGENPNAVESRGRGADLQICHPLTDPNPVDMGMIEPADQP